ncbi:hypothetical protein J4419_00715 [Candidatus Woesearchaeota archaeon]|nr:hypothetical protein [Candidatus Woesearchaeota archaeon]
MAWCFKKAERELREQGKHRGLVKVAADEHIADAHLTKAKHNLQAGLDFERKYPDWAVSALFYSVYHCFLALLAHTGYESRNQECTLALVQDLLDKKEIRFSQDILDAFALADDPTTVLSLRERFQYGTETSMPVLTLRSLEHLALRALEQTKRAIYSP